MEKGKFYITTTLPYVNSDPHIGFALEIIQADVLARYHRLLGEEVFFNTGTDEHGVKIYKKALEENKDVQVYVDEHAASFARLKDALNLSYTNFIRTTDPKHIKATQEIWALCLENGDIYKKNYKIKYCVGCELEKTNSELENDQCSFHPNLMLEEIEEENYFFKFSAYQEKLLKFYKEHSNFVMPDFRFNEIKKFVEGGLDDFSISRLKSKMPWGIAVPNDSEQVMYVWFDALINYISTLGWPSDSKTFKAFWPGIQVAGKDNLRQQAAMWQAMLMSAGLPNSEQVFIHGFITIDGQKMSKSLGNVTDPFELVKKYGADAVRYYLLRETPACEDGDFNYEKFENRYNGDLANGIGNLTARAAALGEKLERVDFDFQKDIKDFVKNESSRVFGIYQQGLLEYRFNDALSCVWELVSLADKYINEQKPWAVTDKNELRVIITNACYLIGVISNLLSPFLPETSDKISQQISYQNGNFIIKKGRSIFPRFN